ncbi:DUF6320 domain-containing protein [Pseudogracilibacillus auburnensis]|nr:DUF6320 domain-containing protein [Pseudogracilibacillus auburnensis]MBO1004651.1 hypothetical protein [Pseudogracilibacillus auburnensis]
MPTCKNCHVHLDKYLKKCPLCLRRMNHNYKSSLYPDYNYNDARKNIKCKVFLFLTIIFTSVCTLINLLTIKKEPTLWFIYVLVIVFYLWVLIGHTIISRKNFGSKIHLQIFALSFLFLVIDLNSGFERWSVNIVIPIIILLGTFLISLKIATEKMFVNAYMGYVMSVIVVGFIPLILYAIGISTLFWPSSVVTLFSLLAIIGVYMFADKIFKAEFNRRFHL